jgi:hypothetical protein
MSRVALVLAGLLLVQAGLAGCLGSSPDAEAAPNADEGEPAANESDDRLPEDREGPDPPPGEEVTGLQPIETIFDGSLRVTNTKVLLVPPQHGDLSQPTNSSRSTTAYLQATLEGLLAWEPAIEAYVEDHPEHAYLENVSVEVDVWDEDEPVHDTAGYDIVIGYAETSGPAFRGVAIKGPANEDQQIQEQINEAGLEDVLHVGHRYILLSLFASAPRAGQDAPDYPERHEVRGVTMHEFAHVWGLGHSTTWTEAYGPDLMNSPYPFVYGDGDPAGDGGERSPELCITSLDLHGLGYLYRWLPDGEWTSSSRPVELPQDEAYERYCEAHEDAAERAEAVLAEHGLDDGADLAPAPGST